MEMLSVQSTEKLTPRCFLSEVWEAITSPWCYKGILNIGGLLGTLCREQISNGQKVKLINAAVVYKETYPSS